MTNPNEEVNRRSIRFSATVGFTLLEVMVAVTILAICLTAIFSSEAGAIKTAQRARMVTIATMLARCKMGELEEKIAKEGLPAVSSNWTDECCKGGAVKGFSCDNHIERIVLPADENQSSGFNNPAKAGTSLGAATPTTPQSALSQGRQILNRTRKSGDGGMPTSATDYLASGNGGAASDFISQIAMQFAYPILKPVIEEQVRRATVNVIWIEGTRQRSFEVNQFLVSELPPRAMMGGISPVPGTGTTPQTPQATPVPTPTTPGARP